MATADSVKAKIQSVITRANTTTGNTDSDLTSAVNSLISGYAQSGDYQLQSKTVSPSTSVQNVTPDNGYYGLSQVKVNAMATATQATPSISVSSAGLITASATQTAGYVTAGTKSATKQLTTQAAKTVTPTTSNQTAVSSGVYTTGAVTVAGDANLVAGNIKSGVKIFGVTGTHSGGGITPTGTINITTNGTHNVTNYASANVNVPTPAQMTVVRTVTLSADITGTGAVTTLISGDEFIKAHYADTGFSALWYLATPVASANGVIHFNYQGNINVGSSNVTRTGVGIRSTSASAVAAGFSTANINGKGYSQSMRVNSNGDLQQYLQAGYILKAGTYIIVLTCIT